MITKLRLSLLLLLIVLLGSIFSGINAKGDSNQSIRLDTIQTEVTKLTLTYNKFGGYRETIGSSKYSAISNGLFTLALFKENELAENEWIKKECKHMLQFIKQNFTDLYFEGFLSFYDSKYPEGHQRTPRLARDHALFALAFNKGVGISSETLQQDEYQRISSETLEFLKDVFGDSNGWKKGTTPYNHSLYLNDTSRDVADISLIIISILEILKDLSSEDQAKYRQDCINAADFIYKYAKNEWDYIIDKVSSNGSHISDTVSCRTNALYGITNIRLYQETNNATYLSRAQSCLQTIHDLFYDWGYPGYITATRDVLTNKRLTDNSLTCLLAAEIIKHKSNDELAKNIFATLTEFIQATFIGEKDIDCASVSRKLIPDEIYSFGSSSYKLWVFSQLPHILSISLPEEIERGDSFNIKTNIYCPLRINTILNITGTWIKNVTLSSYADKDIFTKTLEIKIPDNADTGKTTIKVEFFYLNKSISTILVPFKIKSEGILLPRGVIFVVGAGGLGALALLVKYPPSQIKKVLETVFEEEQEEPAPIKIKKEE